MMRVFEDVGDCDAWMGRYWEMTNKAGSAHQFFLLRKNDITSDIELVMIIFIYSLSIIVMSLFGTMR